MKKYILLVIKCLAKRAMRLGLARTRTPLVSLFSWGSIHAVSPYPVPSLISSDHRRASDTRAATRKHANSSFAGSVVKKVRCEGEKPPHMLETSSSYTSGPACDGLHGGTSKNARYLLTRLPGAPVMSDCFRIPPKHRLCPRSSSLDFGGGNELTGTAVNKLDKWQRRTRKQGGGPVLRRILCCFVVK